ncbi:squalene/phytoene synthase family protein [Actinomycetospora endophytica]|uniref:Squalene/phytoene synthase family protein n=1 Tax=Actinomycetospora endophytica TaxID=2291215 RepID=A0ABS8P7V3_9PSEU|nr:squalene/phytoene synthase family protein [Actinomycetospora endophytica]MCD2194316.1 squalene/phytoene synthase family protein [Actinomycetospora endophytica]
MTTVVTDPRTVRAYATCEAITRTEARNFHYGIRLLPPDRRAALCAVYALARRVDDLGDEQGETARKQTALAELRTQLTSLVDDPGEDPVMIAVADATRRFPIPLGAFDELVDGVAADVAADDAFARTGTASAPYRTFDDLLWYCRCVAGSVGRLCLGVFGTRPGADPDGDAPQLADALGLALQQTNILRDVREDLLNGRIYMPADELASAGVTLRVRSDGVLDDPQGALADLLRDSAVRARGWYDEGLQLVGMLDRRSAACTTAMAGIYRRLLDDITADPRRIYDRRLSLSAPQKALVAVRALTGMDAAGPRRGVVR